MSPPHLNGYRGRFAPSPTGPLHFGSLFAAVISYLDARKNHGKWLVRIEDIDPLREQAGAQKAILNTLIAHGLEWDEKLIFQSNNSNLYEKILEQLASNNLSYHCPCSRKELIHNKGIHSKACQQQTSKLRQFAIKFKSTDKKYHWHDLIQGHAHHSIENDFTLKRKEGFYAYQLAVVCDDIAQDISHVIRGEDLLSSTPMQLALYNALGVTAPLYGHFPLIVNAQGQKLSKQNFAPSINNQRALENLCLIFKFLNLTLPNIPNSPKEALSLATLAWDINIIPTKNIINHTKHFSSDASSP